MSQDHNQAAKRAAFEITDAEIAGIMSWRGPGAYTEATLRKIRRVLDEDRSRRAPAVGESNSPEFEGIGEDGLPPLPEVLNRYTSKGIIGYTAEQVRQAQREAFEAGRRAREGAGEAQNCRSAEKVQVMLVQQLANATPYVTPWQERTSQYETEVFSQIERMEAEIADLRAQLARQSQGASPTPPTAPQDDFRALVKSIIADGYLSETNVHRARLALDGMASEAPAEQKGQNVSDELKPGMVVRVKDPSQFLSAFAKKIADRDAVVNWVGPDRYGQFKGRASVTFQKRNGRGKEFRETMSIRDLVVTAKEPPNVG